MKKAYLLFFVVIFSITLYAAPVVTNATAAQRTDGSKIVDIHFDVSFSSADSVYISLNLSDDAGTTFTIMPNSALLSGDIGKIHTGTGKHIVWLAGDETQDFDGNQFAFKVQAWDMPPMPESFIYIDGGTFDNDGREVTLSSFYLDKYEVTQSEYQAVIGTNPSHFPNVSNGPVEMVSWTDAIVYCNKRSISEGLTPCYQLYYNSEYDYGTIPANWPNGLLSQGKMYIQCNWDANGYRLPTNAEWQFAARGGNQTHNYMYSGSNNQELVAWYSLNSNETTHTIGTKAANELGLFDMSGNVWEWVWDYYGELSNEPQTNPHGPASGMSTIFLGGGWEDNVALHYTANYFPGNSWNWSGFRVCRIAP